MFLQIYFLVIATIKDFVIMLNDIVIIPELGFTYITLFVGFIFSSIAVFIFSMFIKSTINEGRTSINKSVHTTFNPKPVKTVTSKKRS